MSANSFDELLSYIQDNLTHNNTQMRDAVPTIEPGWAWLAPIWLDPMGFFKITHVEKTHGFFSFFFYDYRYKFI